MARDTFTFLVVGIAKYLVAKELGIPGELRHSLNQLALANPHQFPRTFSGLLQRCQQPLKNWWILEQPSNFDVNASLLDGMEPSFAMQDYLEELQKFEKLPYGLSLSQIESRFDNMNFRKLMAQLEQIYVKDPSGAEADYVCLRRFLIEHPYTTLIELSQVLSKMRHLAVSDVGRLYFRASEIKGAMQYLDDNGQSMFWECTHCGPLYVREGQLESVHASVCGAHCPRYNKGWQPIPPSVNRLVVRQGIHRRVVVPGMVEVKLYKWLKSQAEAFAPYLDTFTLWPGIDKYDLQLRFADDEVWAVDVKDYQDPENLLPKLTPLYRLGTLRWDRSFYIYPNYREKTRPDYGTILRSEIHHLSGVEVGNDDWFKAQVIQKIQMLRKGNG